VLLELEDGAGPSVAEAGTGDGPIEVLACGGLSTSNNSFESRLLLKGRVVGGVAMAVGAMMVGTGHCQLHQGDEVSVEVSMDGSVEELTMIPVPFKWRWDLADPGITRITREGLNLELCGQSAVHISR
jgi:hypothetical protein